MTETRPAAAAVSILTGMALIGLIDNFVVALAETGSLWMFHALRSAMIFPICLLAAWLLRQRAWPLNWRAVLRRSLFLSTAMVLYFGALALLPITQAIAGLFTAPLFVLMISVAILREPAGPLRLVAAPMGFLGVLLVLQPWAAATPPLAPLAMLSGLFYAIAMILTRRGCQGETTLALLNVQFLCLGAWGALGAVALTLAAPAAPPGPDGFVLRGIAPANGAFYLWTAVQAVGSLVAVAFLTRAYQLAEAPFVAVFEYTLLIFAASWAFLLWGDLPPPAAVLGIAVILASGMLLTLGERRRGRA